VSFRNATLFFENLLQESISWRLIATRQVLLRERKPCHVASLGDGSTEFTTEAI
jgi:hypothetical protein